MAWLFLESRKIEISHWPVSSFKVHQGLKVNAVLEKVMVSVLLMFSIILFLSLSGNYFAIYCFIITENTGLLNALNVLSVVTIEMECVELEKKFVFNLDVSKCSTVTYLCSRLSYRQNPILAQAWLKS